MGPAPGAPGEAAHPIYTIGHSDRPLGDFLGLLTRHGIGTLVDIRRVPRSRHVPWASQERLPGELATVAIHYHHLPALGGLRRPSPSSPNTGWRSAGFRGYADHMATPAFREGLEELMALARRGRTAIMCAEAVPWRCHRSLVSDALQAEGWRVLHIVGGGPPTPHRPTPFLVVSGGRLLYPGPPPKVYAPGRHGRGHGPAAGHGPSEAHPTGP